jgi:hypothetical protein
MIPSGMDTPRMSPRLALESELLWLLTAEALTSPKLLSWVLETASTTFTLTASESTTESMITEPLWIFLNLKCLWHCLCVLNPKFLPSLV